MQYSSQVSRKLMLDPAFRSLIATFRKSPNWDAQLDLELLQQLWPMLAGETLAAHTSVTAIHGSTVVINVPDLIWRKQLMRMKGQLLGRINEPWGNKLITEIAFTHEN
jgi:predicted nucleic acid-binding Zn ribbon protein